MTGKKNLEKRIDRIDEGRDHPQASLCQLLGSETFETVDEERDLVRLDWGVFRFSPGDWDL